MLFPTRPDRTDEAGERLTDSSPTYAPNWVWGGVVPCVIAVYAVRTIATAHIWFVEGRGDDGGEIVEYAGAKAVALGIAMLSACCFAHFHFVWDEHRRLCPYADLGKIAALVGFIGGFGYYVFRVLVLG